MFIVCINYEISRLYFQTELELMLQKWGPYKVRGLFSACSYKGGEKCASQCQPRPFYRWTQA